MAKKKPAKKPTFYGHNIGCDLWSLGPLCNCGVDFQKEPKFKVIVVDLRDCSSRWELCGRVYDALEVADKDRKRANRWFCRFMQAKFDETLLREAVAEFVKTKKPWDCPPTPEV